MTASEKAMEKMQVDIGKNKDRLVEGNQRFSEICVTLKRMEKAQSKFGEDLSSVHKKLYIDNGAPSIQTKIDRNTGVIKALVWVVGILFIACAGAGAKLLVNAIYTGGN